MSTNPANYEARAGHTGATDMELWRFQWDGITKDDQFPSTGNEKLCAPSDIPIQPGQIRILSGKFVNFLFPPPYVVVLEEWRAGVWLVAPFSPVSVPADPHEMVWPGGMAFQEVVQCWNARTVSDDLLIHSYGGEQSMDAESLEDAKALFRNAMSGKPLPEGFRAIRGSPIESSDDPRREYISHEMYRLQPLTEAEKAREAELARKEAAP